VQLCLSNFFSRLLDYYFLLNQKNIFLAKKILAPPPLKNWPLLVVFSARNCENVGLFFPTTNDYKYNIKCVSVRSLAKKSNGNIPVLADKWAVTLTSNLKKDERVYILILSYSTAKVDFFSVFEKIQFTNNNSRKS
jgi:hypothetical protein